MIFSFFFKQQLKKYVLMYIEYIYHSWLLLPWASPSSLQLATRATPTTPPAKATAPPSLLRAGVVCRPLLFAAAAAVRGQKETEQLTCCSCNNNPLQPPCPPPTGVPLARLAAQLSRFPQQLLLLLGERGTEPYGSLLARAGSRRCWSLQPLRTPRFCVFKLALLLSFL